MPCYDSRDDDARNDAVARVRRLESMLCSTCRTLEASGFDFATNPMVDEWWTAHKEADNQRIRREAAKAQEFLEAKQIVETVLLCNMTPEQKKLIRAHGFL